MTIEDNFDNPSALKIEITERLSGGYHAQFKGHPGQWSAGKSIDEAVGSLLRTHWQELNIGIRLITSETR